MEGLDDIGLTLRHVEQIDAFEATGRRTGRRRCQQRLQYELAPRLRQFFLTRHQNLQPSDCLAARSSLALASRRTVRLPKFPAGLECVEKGSREQG